MRVKGSLPSNALPEEEGGAGDLAGKDHGSFRRTLGFANGSNKIIEE
jgi:hypothetical protein